MADGDGGKEKCKFWEKCYRKDPAHKKQFLHPSDDKAGDEDEVTKGDNSSSPSKKAANKTAGSSKLSGINIKGKTVVFTGILARGTRKQATARATALGLIVKPSVTKVTDIVVVGHLPGKKLDIADDKGIAVLTEDEWEELLLQSSSATGKKQSAESINNKKSQPRKKTKVSVEADKEEDSETDKNSSEEEEGIKPRLRRQRTHNLSDSEDEYNGSAKKSKREKTIPATSPSKAATTTTSPNKGKTTPTSPNKGKTTPTSPNKGKTTPTSTNKGKAPRCKYWDKCYRKDPAHLKAFHHPPAKEGTDDDPGEGTSSGHNTSGGDDEDVAKNSMDVGETVDIGSYRIKRVTDHYYCTCMGWKTQPGPVNKRTCKHLKQYLGEKFEAKRCGQSGDSGVRKASPLKTRSPVKIPQLLLAQKWEEKTDPTGWWMSEKLDGVRAYWNGKGFYSRLGNPFYAPEWFTEGLPSDLTLDGELFGGRGKFQSTVSIVKTPDSPEWKKLKYQIFDIPSHGNLPFEKRMEKIEKYFDENSCPSVIVVEQTKCKSTTHLNGELEKIIALGGEGVMIRQPGSQYEHRRSNTLLKHKKFYDAEARVIGHEPGKGRNTGKCGALRCEMACGKKFSCGSGLTDQDRSKPPKIGSIITYKFQEYTNDGIPRFPTYLGERIDLNQPSDADVPAKPTDD